MSIERLMRLREVLNHTGLGRSTIYAMIARGDFPAPVKIGIQAVAWMDIAFIIVDYFENGKVGEIKF